jgi:hypothetical protein
MTRVTTVPGCPEFTLYKKKKEERKKIFIVDKL